MDVLILQGGGARRRSPSPRSLTQGVYCFPEFQFVVASLIIFLNSIFNSHFFGWFDKLRTIVCFRKRRAPLVVRFNNQVRRGAPTVPSQVGLHLTKLQIPARFFQRIWDLKANGLTTFTDPYLEVFC